MQRKLCLCFGVVLFFAAALLYFSGSTISDTDIRFVNKTEALLVVGGGETGTTCQLITPQCGGGQLPYPCRATSGYTTSTVVGDQKPSTPYNCGAASCGEYSPSMVTVAE